MPGLKTLREVAGLSATPPALKDSVLVMIDCQNTYRDGVMKLAGVEQALQAAAALLETARTLRIPIFHIMHDAGAGSPYDVRAPIGQIADPVAAADGEPVIVKNYPNAFVATELDQRLRSTGAKNLVLAGFMTHMCVNSTARGAFNLGYQGTVVANATATRDLPGPNGRVVQAQALQDSSLAAIGDLFAIVVPDLTALTA